MHKHQKYLKKVKTVLLTFNVNFVEYDGDIEGIKHFSVGAAPSNAEAIRIQKIHQFVFLPIHPSGVRSMEDVLDVLHEASHLILNDFTKGEDCGVAQLELALARRISPHVQEAVERSQRHHYVWGGDPYEKMRSGKDWRKGIWKVKRVLKKFLGNTLKDRDWSFLLEIPKVTP
jgi:hypothetical protein